MTNSDQRQRDQRARLRRVRVPRVPRQQQRERQRDRTPYALRTLTPLPFQSDDAELVVQTINAYPTDDSTSISLTFTTAVGAVNLTVPNSLAEKVGNGMLAMVELSRQLVRERS